MTVDIGRVGTGTGVVDARPSSVAPDVCRAGEQRNVRSLQAGPALAGTIVDG